LDVVTSDDIEQTQDVGGSVPVIDDDAPQVVAADVGGVVEGVMALVTSSDWAVGSVAVVKALSCPDADSHFRARYYGSNAGLIDGAKLFPSWTDKKHKKDAERFQVTAPKGSRHETWTKSINHHKYPDEVLCTF
jgi:hypothetical protein